MSVYKGDGRIPMPIPDGEVLDGVALALNHVEGSRRHGDFAVILNPLEYPPDAVALWGCPIRRDPFMEPGSFGLYDLRRGQRITQRGLGR